MFVICKVAFRLGFLMKVRFGVCVPFTKLDRIKQTNKRVSVALSVPNIFIFSHPGQVACGVNYKTQITAKCTKIDRFFP
jgi:hypothetical protein